MAKKLSRHDEACEWCGSLPGEDHKPTCPESEDDGIKQCGCCGVSYLTNCGCDDAAGTAVR